MVILPSCSLRKGHEDRLYPPPCSKAEGGATIINQVEFHVSTTTHLLPLLVLLREIIVFVLCYDRNIRRHDVVEAVLTECEDFLRISVIHIIEEDATQATSLPSVLDLEIPICPAFETRVELRIMLVADIFVRLMEVLDVLFNQIGRRDISSTAKPPQSILTGVFEIEETVVEVHGGCKRIAWMHDRADGSNEERKVVSFVCKGLSSFDNLWVFSGDANGLQGHIPIHD
mmetsp:Transcript_39394/g.63104  ORF Transcript_39394/g.63104 Transcript_39394/m.63104 type:complete len:229 (-) Transcript_39394:534-1220(-)